MIPPFLHPQVYVREQQKLVQKGKDADQSSTFDAATWAEFQASRPACLPACLALCSTAQCACRDALLFLPAQSAGRPESAEACTVM